MMNTPNFQAAKILIIDDNEANVEFLLQFFDYYGYKHVKIVYDSRFALDTVQSYLPDIILLDLFMPFLSGFDILEGLKAIVPKEEYLPIFILTADITKETKSKAMLLGSHEFVTKPYDLTDLQARMTDHLKIRFDYQIF